MADIEFKRKKKRKRKKPTQTPELQWYQEYFITLGRLKSCAKNLENLQHFKCITHGALHHINEAGRHLDVADKLMREFKVESKALYTKRSNENGK